MKILCVTKSKGGIKDLHDEADRLRLFDDRGIRVPRVIARYLTYDIDILTLVYEEYRKDAPDNIEPVLLGFVRMIRPFGWFVNTFLGSWAGSDVKNVLVSQKVLEAYL